LIDRVGAGRHDMAMRELVYLSERKLRQFQRQRSPRLWHRVEEVGAKAPLNLGEISLGLSEPAKQHPDLARVLRYIDNSDRPPRWFAEEGVRPGDWVQFEARLNYKIVTARRSPTPSSGLLFWEPPLPHTNSPPRLLLHGSPEHLMDVDGFQQPSTMTIGLALSHPAGLVEFFDSLHGESFSQTLWYLLDDLDERIPPELASWMAGYARVTANIMVADTPEYELQPPPHISPSRQQPPPGHRRFRVVVASPLYVEYATAPEPT